MVRTLDLGVTGFYIHVEALLRVERVVHCGPCGRTACRPSLGGRGVNLRAMEERITVMLVTLFLENSKFRFFTLSQ